MRDDDRGTGKTTRLMERAVELVAEGHDVYVTGAHTRWLLDLEKRFKAAGLTGVRFVTMHSVADGALRGCRGRLLIDDPWDMPWRERKRVLEEQRRLEIRA